MENELQIFKYGLKEVRTIIKDGEPWFVAKDVCDILDIKHTGRTVSRLDDDEKKLFKVKTRGGKQRMVCLNQKGIKRLVATSRKVNAVDFAQYLGIDVFDMIVLTKEQQTLNTISSAFKHIKQINQFYIDGYKIDLYFPEYKLAIECDENNHSHYDPVKEIKRQQFIEKKLGCKFIRYNPDDSDFNIGNVINEIMREVYKHERIAKSA